MSHDGPVQKIPLLSYSYDEFSTWWSDQGMRPGALKRVLSKLIRGKWSLPLARDPQLSPKVTAAVNKTFSFDSLKLVEAQVALDQTVKYLFELEDGQKVETVAVPFEKKYTLCLSSQVGCAMGCKFCFTGKQGLSRNLLPHEIVGQYLFVWRDLKARFGHPLTPNIVFMGQGEPLHNFDGLKKAIGIFLEFPGLCLGPKQITVSTVGFIPGIKRWGELPPINLALSLHSPFEEQRSALMPVNNVWSIDKLIDVLKVLPWHHRKRINFEYLLLGDQNDSIAHADALATIVNRFPSLVNLIPFNPYPESPFKRPSDQTVDIFKKRLVSYKIRTMIRTTKGDDILAACGQLANAFS